MNQPYRPSHKINRNSGNPAARPDKPAGTGRPARPDKPAGAGRPARPGNSVRSDKPERFDKPAGTGKPNRPGHPVRSDKPARYDSPARSENPAARTNHSARFDKSARSGKPVRHNKPALAEHSPVQNDMPVKPSFPIDVLEPIRPQTAQTDILPAVAAVAREETAGSPDRLEGRNPILEAIKAGRTINKLWVAKREEKPDPALGRLIILAREAGAVIMETDRRVLDQMSETHGHQGVIAQVAAHEYVELDDLIARPLERDETPFLLILSELQESYNLGSILRIADAAGIHGVIIPQRRSVGLDAAVAKASAGAIEHVPVCRVNNLSQTIEWLKERGFWIAGTDTAGTVEYHAADWKGPLAVLVGSEGEGISPILRKHCDFLISIPMHGKVNSLNAAVATGIIVFEAAHQRVRRTLMEKDSDIGE